MVFEYRNVKYLLTALYTYVVCWHLCVIFTNTHASRRVSDNFVWLRALFVCLHNYCVTFILMARGWVELLMFHGINFTVRSI